MAACVGIRVVVHMSTLCHFKDPWQHSPSRDCQACGYLLPHAPGFLRSGQPGLTQLQLQLPTVMFLWLPRSHPQLWPISHSAKRAEPLLCARQGPRCRWGHPSLWGMQCLPTPFPALWALGSERTGLEWDSIIYELCGHKWFLTLLLLSSSECKERNTNVKPCKMMYVDYLAQCLERNVTTRVSPPPHCWHFRRTILCGGGLSCAL